MMPAAESAFMRAFKPTVKIVAPPVTLLSRNPRYLGNNYEGTVPSWGIVYVDSQAGLFTAQNGPAPSTEHGGIHQGHDRNHIQELHRIEQIDL